MIRCSSMFSKRMLCLSFWDVGVLPKQEDGRSALTKLFQTIDSEALLCENDEVVQKTKNFQLSISNSGMRKSNDHFIRLYTMTQ